MKKRTVEDVHNKYYGHKKFAWFLDTAIEKGHKITNIREFNEKFKFNFNGIPMEFDKMPELSAKWQLEQCELLDSYHKKIEALKRGEQYE